MITASSYHIQTSYERNRMEGHALDWQNQPEPFKHYRSAKHIRLPEVKDLSSLAAPFFSLPQKSTASLPRKSGFDLKILARILILTQTVTARSRGGGMDFYFRSAASAGALYPTEIYLASMGVAGLDDGIYHYSPAEQALALIREGTFFAIEGGASLGLTFFFTAIFFRSSWKYRDRAYRYNLLDTGHMMENHLLALKTMNIPHGISYDFNDNEVNLLLGLDETKEGSLAIVDVPDTGRFRLRVRKDEIAPIPSHIAEASRVAPVEKDYDILRSFHASCMEVNAFSSVNMAEHLGLPLQPATQISQAAAGPLRMDYPEVLFQRRSKRNFVNRPIGPSALADISSAIMAEPYPCVAVGMLVGHDESLSPGLYLFDQVSQDLARASEGSSIEAMADICLHQMWLSNASIHFVFMANLELIDRAAGARGYRYAMMSAGRMGQRLYLSATALGLGCCGIGAFYDRDAAELLGLDSKSRMLYLVAVGNIKK